MSVYTGPDRRHRSEPVAHERRKPGRKPIAEGEETDMISFSINRSLHDRLCLRAIRSGVDRSVVIRLALLRLLSENTDPR